MSLELVLQRQMELELVMSYVAGSSGAALDGALGGSQLLADMFCFGE